MLKNLPIIVFLAIAFLANFCHAQGTHQGPQERIIDVRYAICPLHEKPVKEEASIVFEKKLYRFCTTACLEIFQENPEAVISRITDHAEVPLTITNFAGKLPIDCPITREPATKRVFKIIDDTITFYCCTDCRAIEMKTDDGSSEKAAGEGIHGQGH